MLSINEMSTIVWSCIIHVRAVINNEPGTLRKLIAQESFPPHFSGLLTSRRCHFFLSSESVSVSAGTRSPNEGILGLERQGGRDEGRGGRIVFAED